MITIGSTIQSQFSARKPRAGASVAAAPASDAPQDVQWLTLESGQGGDRLTFDHAQLNGYDPDNPKGDSKREPVVLLDGLRDARFEYRALDEQGELSDWSPTWDDAQRLPLLVRLVAEFDPDSRRRWPDLEIPVLVATAVPGLFNRAGMIPTPGGDEAGFVPNPQPRPEQ